jgi:glycosyltransferase 2 family protein
VSRAPTLDRRALVQGIRLVVALTVLAIGWRAWATVPEDPAVLGQIVSSLRPGWLVLGALLAVSEGVLGGLRVLFLARVLWPGLPPRTAVISEFVLMFCAGVTPGQAGAAPSQVAVLHHAGMRMTDAWTAQLLTAWCTIVVLLGAGLALLGLRASGLLVVDMGPELDALLALSTAVFGAGFVSFTLAASWPRGAKAAARLLARALVPIAGVALSVGQTLPVWGPFAARARAGLPGLPARLDAEVERMFLGFARYRQYGKRAVAAGLVLTAGLFAARFAVAVPILLALGLPLEPAVPVLPAPPVAQVLTVQTLLNFALYLSPTPGASGVAELGSAALMAPWIPSTRELPYLLIWRFLTLFLNMIVGGVYVFRYLGTDVLASEVAASAANAEDPADASARTRG